MFAKDAPSNTHTKKFDDQSKTPGPVLGDRLLNTVRS